MTRPKRRKRIFSHYIRNRWARILGDVKKENLFICQTDWNYGDKQFAQAVEMMKGE